MDKKFLICGGDLRQASVANRLYDYGYKVSVYGFSDTSQFNDKIQIHTSIDQALKDVDIIILPLPCTVDNEIVNMPMSAEKLYITDLLKKMNKNQIIVAGKISKKLYNIAQMYNIYMADYFEREELIVLNVIPTVEGALQIAMEETAITIHGSRCLVMGYGRIGKMLSKSLRDLGANVTVYARSLADLAWIKANALKGISTSQIKDVIAKQDIIINTIPAIVLDEEMLSMISPETLIIDLASKPGGVDFEKANKLGKKVIWALSLPGKVAPITAGEIISDTIINLIDELGV
ncbi:MAG: dipicolinate synthase subunit DpsA [Eubacteriales bacterium]|jgi:dipicolinate synthase subunit A|nr:dipicolinate synthase subunit DpsA [Eubacteriales bacterium]